MKSTLTVAGVLCAALIAGLAAPAVAQVNGGFEDGSFAGWSYSGNSASSAAAFLLARDPLNAGTQAPVGGEWLPRSGGWFAALWSTDSAGSSTATLGQTFSASAGQTLEFDLFYDFGDYAPSTDGAWVTLRLGADTVTLTAFNTAASNQLGDDVNVDWTHYAFALPSGGNYTLEFHITDSDGAFESVLGVDNVLVTPGPGAGALGLAALGVLGRRRR